MRMELLEHLRAITDEERAILRGRNEIEQGIYTDQPEFVIDSKLLLKKGQLIKVRPHTRFAHFPSHRHNYVELVYMCAGQTTHIINGSRCIVLNEGDLLFLNQSVYHEILPAGENDIAVNFIILPEFFRSGLISIEKENILRGFLLSALSDKKPISGYLHLSAKGIPPIENIMESMIWTLINKPSGTRSITQTSMTLLFQNLALFADSINKTSTDEWEPNAVFSILQYIDTNYQKGTLAEISERLKLPIYTVSRLLVRRTGMNFKQLLQQRKLQQAAYMLLHTSHGAEEILAQIGYRNSSFYFRAFREQYGCTPKEYRDRYKKTNVCE